MRSHALVDTSGRVTHLLTRIPSGHDGLADRLLDPERLSAMLTTLAERRADRQISVDRRIAALAREAEDAEGRLRRLYRLVEDGLAQMDEILKDRIASLKAIQAAATAALDRARSATRATDHASPLAVDRFARVMRERLTTGEVPFRKAYIGTLIDHIEVDDAEVRIMGRKEILEQAIASHSLQRDHVARGSLFCT